MAFVFFLSCKREVDYRIKLPNQTTTGENSLGFLHGNGDVWLNVRYGAWFFTPSASSLLSVQIHKEANATYTITFHGSMRVKQPEGQVTHNSDLSIYLNAANLVIGNFSFDTIPQSNAFSYMNNISGTRYSNYTNNSFRLSVIKLDTAARIISGMFSGKLYRKQANVFLLDDALEIQSGRFDVRYLQ